MTLSELKKDRRLFFALMNLKREGNHCPCPFCGDSSSLRVTQERGGTWLWKCYRDCGSGTIIDAAMTAFHSPNIVDALKAIEDQLGVKIDRDEAYEEPIIDQDRAEAFIASAHSNLMGSLEIQEEWLTGKRGISNLDTVRQYRLGFVDGAKFKGKSWSLTGWVLPVTRADGHVQAVKIHTEKPPWPGNKAPKCLWAPFGTQPESEPRHGTSTLWPAPEAFIGCPKLYLCPGELKALAMIGAGLPATSPTAGESQLPERLIKRIQRTKPGQVCIVYDDDESKRRNGLWINAGHAWRDAVSRQLAEVGLSAVPFALRAPEAEPASADLLTEWKAKLKAKPEPESEIRTEELRQVLDALYGEESGKYARREIVAPAFDPSFMKRVTA